MPRLLPANSRKFSYLQITRIGEEWQSEVQRGGEMVVGHKFQQKPPEGRQIAAYSGRFGNRMLGGEKAPSGARLALRPRGRPLMFRGFGGFSCCTDGTSAASETLHTG